MGRGWDRLGYSDLIQRDGTIENLTPYNGDNLVETHEMTWGAAGINSISRHLCLVEGRTPRLLSGTFPFFKIFTEAQFTTLIGYCKQFIKDHPDCKIIGHYFVSDYKTCPNFDVPEILSKGGMEEGNIGLF